MTREMRLLMSRGVFGLTNVKIARRVYSWRETMLDPFLVDQAGNVKKTLEGKLFHERKLDERVTVFQGSRCANPGVSRKD